MLRKCGLEEPFCCPPPAGPRAPTRVHTREPAGLLTGVGGGPARGAPGNRARERLCPDPYGKTLPIPGKVFRFTERSYACLGAGPYCPERGQSLGQRGPLLRFHNGNQIAND
jgi:hypothetical protein